MMKYGIIISWTDFKPSESPSKTIVDDGARFSIYYMKALWCIGHSLAVNFTVKIYFA